MEKRFANQALGAIYVYQNGENMENKVYRIPEEIDREIARYKLQSMGVQLDKLTEEQDIYLNSWTEGT
jgi:adenosylhomocysteinase